MILNPPEWPDGARCAVAFTYDMDADSILHFDHHSSADTRVAAMSMLRYGPEVAGRTRSWRNSPALAHA